MEGWWQGFGEPPKINCKEQGLKVWENILRLFLDNAKAAIIDHFPKPRFRLILTAGDGKKKPEILTVKKTRTGHYSAVAVTNVNKIHWIADGGNRAKVLNETETHNNYKLQMYLFFCMGEDTGIIEKNGPAVFRKCLTMKEIEFMVAVSLSGAFRDGNLIPLAMPYFDIEELNFMLDSMQEWLMVYMDRKKMADVKDYFKNHYENTYNLVMTPLKAQHEE